MIFRIGHLTEAQRLLDRRMVRGAVVFGCLLAIGIGQQVAAAPDESRAVADGARDLEDVLHAARRAYASAGASHLRGSQRCVDGYFDATQLSWRCIELAQGAERTHDQPYRSAWSLYHRSLARLVRAGQHFGRLDPAAGLLVNTRTGSTMIPVIHEGFPWKREDFSRLLVTGSGKESGLATVYRRAGLGVPLLVVRQHDAEERFHTPRQFFAATAVLCRSHDTEDHAPHSMTLVLFDPLRVQNAKVGGHDLRLATDISAPIAYLLKNTKSDALAAFLQPGLSTATSKLTMLEPYQPGKIPLIFIHGLLSDPLTWADVGNEIRARPDLIDRYQIWVFRYPTGEPFLRPAAALREECQAALHTLDPEGRDPALSQMVLIGHSMGGLVAKLQVTYANTLLWDALASVPLDRIRATPEQRETLSRLCFFQPQPSVKRVIFIGTPHGGSSWAKRLLGRLASRMVKEPQDRTADLQQLLRNNPGVFARQLHRRIPTSVDMLEPDNPMLEAIRRLPVSSEVTLHSIIGTGRRMLVGGPADGVVPVSSARHPGVATERLVDAKHGDLHHHPCTIQEIVCILNRHLIETGLPTPPSP
ncbi:MAG: alpha/beta fold hydrolase [Planctomycetes bacterium]|nr:alpha/beta fold hydrolase [Planctomycetota bacterium]